MLPDSINISLNTGANPAFEMDDNDGVGISVIHEVRIELGNGTLDIDTTSGRAFSATNGGQLRVVGGAAGSRTIDSTTGQALMIDGIELIAPGVGFTRVAKNSATGATTGITISNMIYKDGIVDIGNTVVAGTDAGFEGILISDLTNTLGTIKSLKLRNLDIDDTGADGIKISNLDDVSVDVRGGSIMNVGRNGVEVDNGSLSFWDAMISGTFPTFDGIDVADDIGEDAGLTDNLHIRNSTIVGASRGVSITVTNHGVMNDGGRVFALIETSNITGGSDEILASASSIVDPSTICLNAAGNTLDGGSGVISLSQSGSGFLSVHQSVAGTPGTGVDVVNGIPMGNVVTAGTITYDGSACIT